MANYFSNIFGQSPIRPLQAHIGKAYECAQQLPLFLQAVAVQNWQAAQQLRVRIVQLENEADEMKKKIRMHLPSGLFMPFSRPDLLELLKFQDKIANRSKDIAGIIIGRKTTIPAPVQQGLSEFLQHCIEACALAEQTINELDELVATGFRGAEVALVQSMIKQLDVIENETDAQQIAVRAALFAVESQYPAVEVMFLYKIIEWIGDLADFSQSVGHCLERMLAR